MIEGATLLPVRGFSDGTFSIVMVKRMVSASTVMLWVLRVTRRVGPDFQLRAVRPDAGEAQRRGDIDIGGKAARALARRAVEYFQRLLQAGERNAALDADRARLRARPAACASPS